MEIPSFDSIVETVEAGGRLSLEEGLRLLREANLLELGRLAAMRRRAKNGDRATYVVNLHVNVSNLCVNRCRFCAYRRDADDPAAYEMAPEEIWDYVERMAPPGVREFHLVSGLSPNLGLDFYERVLRGLRERFPEVHLKAFTAVEIAHLACRDRLSVDDALRRLIDSGLGSLTGGGAETLSDRVRRQVCPEKLDGEGYLDVHRRAHRLGLRSTATLLFGHVETPEERLDHLYRLRALQDEAHTGGRAGFTAFVPLVFHPANTELARLPRATGRRVLETIALARLILDNFDHIKAYWVSLGPKVAQLALAWGADDLDGTVAVERIHHSAGAESPQSLAPEEIRALIREAGLRPVERDALYEAVRDSWDEDGDHEETGRSRSNRPSETAPHLASRGRGQRRTDSALLEAVASGERRMTPDEAERLFTNGDLLELGRAARAVRRRLHPEPVVTYVVDRNINTTNQCESLCAFCAFARPCGDAEGYVLDRETIASKIEELVELCASRPARAPEKPLENGGLPPPQILMQGGLCPDLDLAWYEDLFRWMRERWPSLHIHALSPPEIQFLARKAGLDWPRTIRRLREAGLDSVPGGGAEILSDRLRKRLSPRKCSADDWIGVMRAVFAEGLRASATMVIGLGETAAQRAEHLERIRALQNEAGQAGRPGFTAFIPWTFQAHNTPLGRESRSASRVSSGASRPALRYGAGAHDYLRTLAIARLYLDNIDNVQASWVTQGRDVAQIALLFGANDLGSTMIEENVVA
ncbi:MAG TPA: CofH family radical SAM protein, partial [Sumerlaeia bacterium]|nr:CofH family radical SAM protein [Sumerlaeia bacterium]